MQRRALLLMLGSTTALAACGRGVRDSNWNPGNWFGRSRVERRAARAAASETPQEVNPLIPEQRDSIFRRKSDEEKYAGTPIHTVTDLVIERSSGGAIVRATGVSMRQGAFDVRLKSQNDGEPQNGVMTYMLEAVQPTNLPQGTQRSRTVNAAIFISDQTLNEVRTIRVAGLTNARTSARR
ncbi:hypothetical protein [Roseovarius pelagicus]|uniref:Lipoprotein n=1 Tax=Roseovarius pelagicus TaxID=2980108 RepID=A0ABY6DB61_9RHOB|nr:hypothetical protein [Roseovarius pelagicus]UXX83402.1 hypothetical protein N7U68_01570 [Roseovarius pelagicus]